MDAYLTQNFVRPYLFEHLHIRGSLVRLRAVWQQLQDGRDYAPPVARLLGEMSAITALLAANLKQAGRITFQLKGNGPVNLLVLDCDQQLRLRGMARAEPEVADNHATTLLGDGQLAFTLESADQPQPYQSLVPLAGETIAAIFEHYLEQSEQLPARLYLASNGEVVAGLFLQKMPGADEADADGWNRIQICASTVQPDELTDLSSVNLLRRLFVEEDIRLFDPRPVTYHCPEDWSKVAAMLRTLGRAECESIVEERGEIHIHDDICLRDYRFDGPMIAALFDAPAPK